MNELLLTYTIVIIKPRVSFFCEKWKCSQFGSKEVKRQMVSTSHSSQDTICSEVALTWCEPGWRLIWTAWKKKTTTTWKRHTATARSCRGSGRRTHNFHLQHSVVQMSSLPLLHLSHCLSPQALSQSASPRLPPSVCSTRLHGLIRLGLSAPQCLHEPRETETRWLWRRAVLHFRLLSVCN